MGAAVARTERRRQSRNVEVVRRVAGNAASMFASDVINRATTFALYALVARHLGAYAFGQLSLALTLFYTFQVLAVAGLKTLVTREVAKHRELTDRYLANASYVVLLASLLSIIVAALFVWAMGYSTETSAVVLLLVVGLIPVALSSICEAIFQAWERMRLIAMASVPINALKVAAALLVLSLGADLMAVLVILLAAQVALVIAEWVLLVRHVTVPRLALRPEFAARLARRTLTFLGIDGVIAVTGALNIVLLSKFRTEADVGLFNAGTQLLVPVIVVFQSIVLSVFPLMCRRHDVAGTGLTQIGARVIELMLSVSIPTAVGLYFLAEPAVRLLYGADGLEEAAAVVRVLAWTLILTSMTSILGQVLIASLRESTTLRIVVVDLLVSVVAGFALIHWFGFEGAALTALVTRLVDLTLHYVPVAKQFPIGLMARVAWKPVIASSALAGYFLFFDRPPLLVAMVAGAAVYAACLAVLTIATYRPSSRSLRPLASHWFK